MKCINLRQYEKLAQQKLQSVYYDYFAGGAGNEITLRDNENAFDRIRLRPRILRGAFQGDLETDLLGTKLAMPVLIAPTAFHCLAHPDGECATACAAQIAGTVMIISMAATTAIEEITAIAATPKSTRQAAAYWFQLYIQPDRSFTRELVHRVEAANCTALVLTADSPSFGRHQRDLCNNFTELPEGMHCEQMKSSQGSYYRNIQFDAGLSWDDVDWLQSITNLPIVIKGVTDPDDALLAVAHGAQSIVVSNHGGRQLDTIAATVDLLPDIANALGDTIPIILDGGVRQGTDIVKALALGATAVAVGRPVLWGLAVDGQCGVETVLSFLKQDLLNTLMLCGCQSLHEIDQQILFRSGEFLL